VSTSSFPGVPAQTLFDLADALVSGRLAWPPSALSLRARGYSELVQVLLGGLTALQAVFPAPSGAAAALRLVGAERAAWERADDRRLDLVWSGPEAASQSRDTGIAVRELFADARRKVLLSTYNLGAPSVLAPLVERRRKDPAFEVRMFVNISDHLMREWRAAGEDPLAAFRRRFAERYWSGAPLPTVFYDPRALSKAKAPQLHAKCIVVDDEVALVTSANFSEAAQTDNIEAGVVVRDPRFASALSQQFEGLVARGLLEQAI
jgi:phosphatidylserine/phosphatidylglycerophosphate/cardiolipin synthase-like enzyme